MGTRHKNKGQEKSPDRAMANIQCANTGHKIRLKKECPDRPMANGSATIIGHQGTDVGPIEHSFKGCHGEETQGQAQEKSPERATANIQCANTGGKVRLKKESPHRTMTRATATIIGHQGTDVGPI